MPRLQMAPRVDRIEPFLAMEVMERAFEIERAGGQVIHLEIGEPDLAPPAAAVDACKAALDAGETHYSDSRGLPELRAAIAAEYGGRHGLELDPERVIVTSGTSPAMLLVFSLLVDVGDEVILATPHYPCYPNFVHMAGGTPVFVETRPADAYRLDPDTVRAALTPRTRAIVLASPANPTGAVQEEAAVRELGALGIPLVSDEIYDGLVYDSARVTSALVSSGQAFILDGFSKRHAMTGFRLGHVIAPTEAVRPLQVLQQSLFISANRFVQHAGIAALADGGRSVEHMRNTYDARRKRLFSGLQTLGFELPCMPRGAFYVFADAQRFDRDSRRLSLRLLEEAGVATTPGVDFGPAGEGWLRFCYARPEAELDRALERLDGVLS